MKTVFKLLLCSVLFVACGEADTAIYNGEEGQSTFMKFGSEIYTLPVKVDETGEVDVTVFSSTTSSQDRVINITRVEEGSNAAENIYSLPTSVTIPAGEYSGTFTITGSDIDLEDPQFLVIAFTSADDSVVFDSDTTTIRIEQVCPIIRDEFVGTYTGTELPGPYTYTCEVIAGPGEKELIIKNVWEADASSTTSIFLNADQFVNTISWPAWQDNFLFVHPTYGDAFVESFHPSNVPSSVDACTKTITLYFRIRVSAGTFAPNTLTLVKND